MTDFTVDLQVSIAGQESLNRRIATTTHALENMGPLWGRVAQWFYQMEATQFHSEGHGGWKPLALSTQKRRKKLGYGAAHPILEMSGKLAGSLLGGTGHVRVETPLSITLGTDLKVGKWTLGMLHQLGTHRMPARPVIGRTTQAGKPVLYAGDITALRKLVADYIHESVTKT